MPDGKANKPFHWKNKLEGLEDIPGETPFDRAAAWQTLYGRLQQKPLLHTTTRYRVAAACLLGIMALSMLVLIQRNDNRISKNAQPKQVPLSKPLPQPDSRNAVAVSSQPAVKKKSASPLATGNKLHPALVHAAGSQLVLPSIEYNLPATTTPQPDDTMRLIAAVPAKKKLRVVHINELNNPVDDGHLASNVPAASPKKLLLEDDAGLSLSRNASDNIVKIKLSSSK